MDNTLGRLARPRLEDDQRLSGQIWPKELIYYPAYYASSGSATYNANPSLFPYGGGQGQCYGGNLTDFTQATAVSRLRTLLVNNAAAWGD